MEFAKPITRFFHPIVPSKQLKNKPFGFQLGGQKLVLFRDQQGQPAAVDDRCSHRFTPLSEGRVTDGKIVCPYHGWRFDSHGVAQKPHQLASQKCNIKSYQVVEKYDFLWVADRDVSLQTFPQFDTDGFVFLAGYSETFEAPLHVVVDNFSEDEHFPYVHNMFGWDEAGAKDIRFSYKIHPEKISVHYLGPQRVFPFMQLSLMKPGDYFRNDWETEFNPIRTTYNVQLTDKDGNPRSGANRVFIYFVPVSEKVTRLQVFQFATMKNPKWNFLLPLFKYGLVTKTRADVVNDAHFTKKLADIPYSFKGMLLDKYDPPLFHGRRLMEKLYFGKEIFSPKVPPEIKPEPTVEMTPP